LTIQPEARLVTILGKLVVSQSDLAAASRILNTVPNPGRLRRAAIRSKALPVLFENLKGLPTHQSQRVRDILADQGKHLAPAERRRNMLEYFRELARLAEQHGLRLMPIKGLSLMFLLPDYSLRSLNDLDYVLPDLPALLTWVRILQDRGLGMPEGSEAPRLLYSTTARHLKPTLEAHFAVYGGDYKHDIHSRCLSAAGPLVGLDLWSRSRRVEVGGVSISVPTPEDAILILLGHVVDHGYFTLKDFNDLYSVLAALGHSLDWDYLFAKLQENGLDLPFAYMVSFLEREYHLTGPDTALVGTVEVPRLPVALRRRFERGGLHMLMPPWWRRAMVAGTLSAECRGVRTRSFPASLRRTRKITLSALRELSSGRGWVNRLSRDVFEWVNRGAIFTPTPPEDEQFYLTEVSARLQEAWLKIPFPFASMKVLASRLSEHGFEVVRWGLLLVIRRDCREVVVCPAGLFIPTRTFAFMQSELSELASMALLALSVAQDVTPGEELDAS